MECACALCAVYYQRLLNLMKMRETHCDHAGREGVGMVENEEQRQPEQWEI